MVIYAGQAFSLLGSAAVQLAVIWWLTVQTGSAITLALATIVSCLPNMIIGPFAGVWVDKNNRPTVMIGADGLVALSSLILGAAFMISRTPPVGLVYIILFLRGLGESDHFDIYHGRTGSGRCFDGMSPGFRSDVGGYIGGCVCHRLSAYGIYTGCAGKQAETAAKR